jgi:hypothetical protein
MEGARAEAVRRQQSTAVVSGEHNIDLEHEAALMVMRE